jgi:HSP20 family protein
MEVYTMAKEVSRPTVMDVRPTDPLEGVLDTFMPGFFSPASLRRQSYPQVANIDVIDRDDAFILKAEIPGVEKNDLDIQVHGNQVYLGGVKQEEKTEKDANYVYRERHYGEFSRTIQLPVDINSDQVKATFKDGVLELVLPKTESAKRKRITIS